MARGGHGHGRFLDEDAKPPEVDYKKVIRKMAPLLWPENLHLKFRVVLCGLTILIARVANLMVPQMYKGAIDTLTGSDTSEPAFPTGYIAAYTVLKIIQSLQRDIRGYVWLKVEQDTSKRVKLKVFTHLHSLSLKYHLTRKTGEVLKVMERGAASVQQLLNMTLFTVGPTLLDLALVCIVLFFTTHAVFALVILVTMSAYIWVTIRLIEWRKKFRRDMIDADNAMNDRSVNTLLNFETVKYFGMETREREELGRNIDVYNGAAMKNESSLYALNAAQQVIVAVGGLLCMLLSAYYVMEGELTVGDFVMIQTYLAQVAAPLNWLGTAWRVIQQGFIDMEKMFELLEIDPEIVDLPNAPELQVSRGTIEYDKVHFKYASSGPTVLRNINFVVPPGTTASFVGKTGAGKSTIARLLFRFYDLDRDGGGAIRIDGEDIRDVKQESLRKAIGVVPQDSVLFNDTIKYNLTYGRPDASEYDMEEAAKAAQIYDTIMNFPEKWDTKVGERGLRLSGGEKQRVAIARTILKDPKIVLLDEATSALDTQTEHHIQGALEEMCKGRTTLIIAHRLSTVIHSDQIFVINGGEVSESGTHQQLVSKGGEFFEMWKRQQEMREGAGTAAAVAAAAAAGASPISHPRTAALLTAASAPGSDPSSPSGDASPKAVKPVTYV